MATATHERLLIGELADRVGVNPKTVRYYEDIGLLPAPARTESGYRVYDRRDVERIRFIRRAQQLELKLDEIAEILALRDGGEIPCSYVRGVVSQRLVDLDERIAQMQEAREDLAMLLATADDRLGGEADYCPLIEHRPAAD